jgi:hypothetical protein
MPNPMGVRMLAHIVRPFFIVVTANLCLAGLIPRHATGRPTQTDLCRPWLPKPSRMAESPIYLSIGEADTSKSGIAWNRENRKLLGELIQALLPLLPRPDSLRFRADTAAWPSPAGFQSGGTSPVESPVLEPARYTVSIRATGLPRAWVARSSGDLTFDSLLTRALSTDSVRALLLTKLGRARPGPDTVGFSLSPNKDASPATTRYFSAALPIYLVSPVFDRSIRPPRPTSGREPQRLRDTDVQYLVLPDGSVAPESIRFLRFIDPKVADWFREWLIETKYSPYILAGCPLSQLVQRRIKVNP